MMYKSYLINISGDEKNLISRRKQYFSILVCIEGMLFKVFFWALHVFGIVIF